MGHAVLQQFVVNVFAIGSEDRTSANQATDDGERGFQNRQAKRNDRDGDGYDGRSLLCSLESQGAQDKADEETAGVSQKNGRGIEVEAEESENRARQRNRHHCDQGGPVEQSHHKSHQSREQGRSGSQTIEAVNQIKRVGDGDHPKNREGPSHEPRQLVVPEKHRDVDDAQTAHEQHRRGNALYRELDIRTDPAKVVVNAQQKDERRRREDGQQYL